METNILNMLLEKFKAIGTEPISGYTAVAIINSTVNELTVPKHVQDAQKYVRDCAKDWGFMGSPEYDRQMKIVKDYFEPLEEKKKEEEKYRQYLKLKAEYESTNL